MANSDKNIRIETNKGKSGYPNIAFIGSTNDPINLYVLDDNTLSFEGSTGQLFSVSNSVTSGTIFSVNDISGIPSLRVDADGTVGIAEFSGNVGVGTVNPLYKLDVNGDINAGSGKTLRIGGVRVLDSTTLGSAIVNSSLTGFGTVTSGTWNGTPIAVLYGGTGATTAADARTNLSAATAGTNSDITVLNAVQRMLVTIPSATGIGITVRGATSQTGNLQQWQNSSASNLSWINSSGTFSFGASFTHADGRTPGVSVQAPNAAGIVARGFNSDAFPAIEVQNNPGSLTVGLYPSGLVYGGVLQAYSSTASTSSTTGVLLVAGGAGIAKTSYFGQSVVIQGTTASGSTTTGALVVTGGVGIGGTLNVNTANVVTDFNHTPNNTTIGGASGWVASTASTFINPNTFRYLNNKYIGIGGTYVYYSDDMINWSSVMVPNLDPARPIANITYGEGKYVFVQYYTANAGYSTNLTSWTNVAIQYQTWNDVIYGNGRFVATVGADLAAYSLDGTSWTSVTDSIALGFNTGLKFINGYFYVTNSNAISRSIDGITWQVCNTPAVPYGLAYGNGLYVGGVYNSGTIVYSYDGLNFSSYSGSSFVHNGSFFYNGVYYLTTQNNNVIRYSTDGFNWTNSTGFPSSVNNLQYAKGFLYAGSGNTVWVTNATPGRFEVNPLRTGTLDDVEIGRLSPNNANFIDVSVNNNLNVSSQYSSTSPLNGALTVAGGAGIAKTSYFGQSVVIQGSTASGSTTTGALTVSGGVGIGGSLNVFGTIDVSNNIEILAQKELRFFNSGNTFYTGLRAGSSSANVTFTLPIADGTSNQALITNGSAALGWTSFVTAAITSLNGLTAATQTFATGTSGSDFNISSSTSTHTFNIPYAGAASTGLITTQEQTIAGAKTFSGNTIVSSSTASTNTTTGALIVIGGVGIGASVNIGGRVGIGTDVHTGALNIKVPSTTTSGIIIRGNTSQTADAITYFSAAGDTQYAVNANGRVRLTGMDGIWSYKTQQNIFDVSDGRVNWNLTTWQYSSIYWVNAGATIGQASNQLQISNNGTTSITGVGVLANGWSTGGANRAFGIVSPSGSERTYFNGYGNLVINPNNPNPLHSGWNTMDLLTMDISGTASTYSGNIILGKVEGTNRFVVGPYGNTTVALGGTTVSNALILKGASSQTGNLMEFQSSTGTTYLFINSTGQFGPVTIASSTASTNTATGALVVTGGVGIGASVNIGGKVGINTAVYTGTFNITTPSASTPGLVVQGSTSQTADYLQILSSTGTTSFLLNSSYQFAWPNIGTLKVYGASYSAQGRLQIDGCLSVATGPFLINTGGGEASMTSSGLSFAGGIGLGTYSTNTLSTNNPFRVQPTDTSVIPIVINAQNASWTSGNLFLIQNNGSSVFSVDYAGNTNIFSTVGSASTTSGALIVRGGVGIGGSVNAGGISRFTSATASTSSSSGALIVTGGIGVGQTSYFASDEYVQGRLYLNQATLGVAGTTVNPSIAFIGQTNNPITLSILSDNSLSFEGSSGQLFSINNNLTSGTIFSVSDISGLPILRANANGTLSMAEFGTNVGIGTSLPNYKLHVMGDVNIGTGYTYRINGTKVVDAVSLGSAVVSSSLTSVGTLNSGVWNATTIGSIYGGTGQTTYTDGQLLIGSSTGGTLIKSTLTQGSGILITNSAGSITISTSGSGITSLNGLSAAVQTFATGTSGTDFNISSSTSTHTFNIPYAGAASTGLITTQTQTIAGDKTFSGNTIISSSTASTSSTTGALTVTGGAGIAKTSYFGQDVKIQGTTSSTGFSTGALTVAGGVGISGKLSVNTGINVKSPYFSTELADFAGNAPFGVNFYIRNIDTQSSSPVYLFVHNSSIQVDGAYASKPNLMKIRGLSDVEFITGTGYTHVFRDGPFGSEVMRISVAGASVLPTIASGSTTTGALVVSGGVGIGGSLNVFGTIDVSNNIEVLSQKEVRFFNSANTFYTGLRSGSSSANVTFTLPIADGSANQVLYTNGSAALGWTTVATAITTLNGLTASTQTFATGTSGTDFNISSSTSTHTFNIPYAGAASTGLITTGAQTIAGAKTFSGNTIVSSSTASTTPTTGALVVTGGVGIGGRLNVGSRATTYSNPAYHEVLAGFATSFNGSATVVIENLRPGDFVSSSLILKNPGGNAFINFAHYPGYGQTILAFNNSYGEIQFYTDGGLYSFFNGQVLIDPNDQPASTSTSTGALRVTGGAGIAKTSYFGQSVFIQGSTASGSTTTGALVVTGGVGIGGSLWTSSSNLSSISGVTLNNGTITGTLSGTATTSTNQSTTTLSGTMFLHGQAASTGVATGTTAFVGSGLSFVSSTGTLTAAFYNGSGIQLSGIVTSLASSTGISVNSSTGAVTVTNTGVISLTGTANQVLVNGASGVATSSNITLTTPQSIGTASSPSFADVTLTTGTNSTLAAVGSAPTSIVNKQYVDNLAAGLDIHESMRVLQVSAIGASYVQTQTAGAASTSSYLISTTQVALPAIDGVTISATGTTQRILITGGFTGSATIGGTAAFTPGNSFIGNGSYYVASLGGAGTSNWILVRTPDADDNVELTGGTFTFIEEGTSYADSGWVCSNDTLNQGSIQFGSTAISFTQFTGGGALTVGQGLTKVGNNISANIKISAIGSASGIGYTQFNLGGTSGGGTADTGYYPTFAVRTSGAAAGSAILTLNTDGFSLVGSTNSNRTITVTGSDITLTGGGNTLTLTGSISLPAPTQNGIAYGSSSTALAFMTAAGSGASVLTQISGSAPVYLGQSQLVVGGATTAALLNTDASTATRFLVGTVLNTASGSTQLSTGSGITIGNNLLTSGGIAVTNITASTSSTTGALTVTGGAGIAKTSYFGQDVKIQGTTSSTGFSTGALTVAGGVGIGGRLYVNGGINVKNPYPYTDLATFAGDSPSGIDFQISNIDTQAPGPLFVSLNTQGGVVSLGLKNAYIQVDGINNSKPDLMRITGTRDVEYATGVGYTHIFRNGGYGTELMRISGIGVSVLPTTASGSTTTGALVVTGGVGIGGSLNVFGTIDVSNNIEVLSQKEVRFFNSANTFYTGLRAGSSAANVTFTLPVADGSANQVLYTNGSAGLAWTTLPSAITTLNGLTASTQTFATGTSGTDFNISSSTSTHTFNIPYAGSGATGLITTQTQTIAGAKTFSGNTIVSSSTASTSPTTGALTVTGGVGIAKTSYFGQDVKILGTTQSTSQTTGALTVEGGVGIKGQLTVGVGASAALGIATFASGFSGSQDVVFQSHSSNSFSSIGLEFRDYLNNIARISFWSANSGGLLDNDLTLYNELGSIKHQANGATKFHGFYGGIGVSVFQTTVSTSTTTGALTVSGGAGIAGSIWSGQHIVTDTTTSSSTSTGAMLVYGGLGVSGQVNAASLQTTGNAVISGNLTFNGVGVFGNATSDTINSLARYISDILPSTDNSYDLGNNSLGWRNFRVSGVGTIATLAVTSSTASTNTTTGALRVSGGAGIALTSYFGQDVKILGSTASTSSYTGSLTVAGGVGISGSLYIGVDPPSIFGSEVIGIGGSNAQITIKNTYDGPDSKTSGIVILNDANYLAGFTYGQSYDAIPNQLQIYNQGNILYDSFGTNSIHQFLSPLADIELTIGGAGVSVLNLTASTSSTSGALTVTGGAGIAKTSYFGQDVKIQGTTASTSTSTGALVVSGGVGIGGSLWTSTSNLASVSGVTLNNGTITSGVWGGTAISAVNGGTGQNTYVIGDILYASSTSALTRLAAGTASSVLTSNGAGTAPSWKAISASGTVTSGTAGSIAYYTGTGSTVGGSPGFTYTTSGTASTINVFGGSAIGTTIFTVQATSATSVRVGIGTNLPQYELEIVGELSATNKSFVIDHPTKPGKKLRYGSLEGPENGVYVRGELKDSNIIETPDHWVGLVHPDSFTVTLTPIGRFSYLYVEKIEDYKVFIADEYTNPIHCYYTVWAERKDIPKLITEY